MQARNPRHLWIQRHVSIHMTCVYSCCKQKQSSLPPAARSIHLSKWLDCILSKCSTFVQNKEATDRWWCYEHAYPSFPWCGPQFGDRKSSQNGRLGSTNGKLVFVGYTLLVRDDRNNFGLCSPDGCYFQFDFTNTFHDKHGEH